MDDEYTKINASCHELFLKNYCEFKPAPAIVYSLPTMIRVEENFTHYLDQENKFFLPTQLK